MTKSVVLSRPLLGVEERRTRHQNGIVYTPPEEYEGISCKRFFKWLHFLCKVMGLAGQF